MENYLDGLEMKMMRLTFALIVFAWASGLIAQESSGYIETNVGVSYTNAEVDYFPDISFLYGRRMFLSNTSFWDVQIGLAAPSVGTTKVGWGYRSAASDFSVSTGVRIWPAHVYLQFGIPDKRCSNEVSDRMQRRLDRRGKDSNDLVCGEWTLSLEGGLGGTRWENFSLESIAIATVSHRWYFE